MKIIYQGSVLLLFFSFLKAENQSAPPNPECKGMKTAAKNLEGGIRLALKTSPHCKPNEQCTGVKCTWPTNGFLEVDLQYCNSPVTYRVYFKQDHNKEKNFTLKQQDERDLYKSKFFGTFKIKVNTLHRSGNTVTTNVGLLVCHQIFPGQKCHTISLMPEQTFCVQMDKCPGFNTSLEDDQPCSYPTQPQSDKQSSPKPAWGIMTSDPPSEGNLAYRKDGKGGHKGHKVDASKDLSTAAIIGICGAALFVILLVVGVSVYWKKYHHKSRLRAAYYNDISMHDPLYVDFGPEVA
ncbi:uncharacterized protein [Montipora capricornis]|uniref:uncharacterized protein n=1 Tax=Montipora capricornis TaxID=246305 RepID=UPI0035F1D057